MILKNNHSFNQKREITHFKTSGYMQNHCWMVGIHLNEIYSSLLSVHAERKEKKYVCIRACLQHSSVPETYCTRLLLVLKNVKDAIPSHSPPPLPPPPIRNSDGKVSFRCEKHSFVNGQLVLLEGRVWRVHYRLRADFTTYRRNGYYKDHCYEQFHAHGADRWTMYKSSFRSSNLTANIEIGMHTLDTTK